MGTLNFIALTINGDSNPWDYLGTGNVLDSNSPGVRVVTSLAADWYSLCITIGVIGIIVTIVYMGLRLIITKDSRKREEVKEAMKWKVALALVLFSMSTVLGIVVSIATALV